MQHRISYNPGQNIWNKIDKSSKTGHGKKSLISTFAGFFFDCYYQSLIFGRETEHWAMSPLKFGIFLIFPYFLRSLVLSCFATHEATQIPKFAVLDIIFCFTCG